MGGEGIQASFFRDLGVSYDLILSIRAHPKLDYWTAPIQTKESSSHHCCLVSFKVNYRLLLLLKQTN